MTIKIPEHFTHDQFDMGNKEYFNKHIRGRELKVVRVGNWFTTVEDTNGNRHSLHGFFKEHVFQLLVTKIEESELLSVYER